MHRRIRRRILPSSEGYGMMKTEKRYQKAENTLKQTLLFIFLIMLVACLRTSAATSLDSIATLDDKGGYKIEKPGTITFIHALVVKGKAEKPQVVIFLPKEKSLYEPMTFNRSFVKDIMKPLPLVPVTE
jgi:hypothetical protein